MLALKLLALRALAAAADTGASSSDPCFADASNTFHVSIDPYASELGSWKFLECGDTPMPVLAVEKGVTYTFEQFDPSNWYHPLAFGTEPDDDEDDLATHYLNGAQIDEDAYDDGFVVSRVAWLDASGQSQDEDEGGDEEEDAGEAGDEDADADEDRRLQAVAGYSVTLTVTDEVGDEGEDADEDRRLQAGGDLFYMCNAVWKSISASDALGDGAAVLARSSGEEPPRHATEEALRRWRGGGSDDSARTRSKILISTQVSTTRPVPGHRPCADPWAIASSIQGWALQGLPM